MAVTRPLKSFEEKDMVLSDIDVISYFYKTIAKIKICSQNIKMLVPIYHLNLIFFINTCIQL